MAGHYGTPIGKKVEHNLNQVEIIEKCKNNSLVSADSVDTFNMTFQKFLSNPKRPGLFWDVLFGGKKFTLPNCLSNKDLSISHKSWDVQLTFDNLINAFRFKEEVALKSKMCVSQDWTNLENRPPIP